MPDALPEGITHSHRTLRVRCILRGDFTEMMQWKAGPNAGKPPAHDGFLWPIISTQLDRDSEEVGGTLTLQPERA